MEIRNQESFLVCGYSVETTSAQNDTDIAALYDEFFNNGKEAILMKLHGVQNLSVLFFFSYTPLFLRSLACIHCISLRRIMIKTDSFNAASRNSRLIAMFFRQPDAT